MSFSAWVQAERLLGIGLREFLALLCKRWICDEALAQSLGRAGRRAFEDMLPRIGLGASCFALSAVIFGAPFLGICL